MKNIVDWADRPLWVRVGLFGVRGRKVAMCWMYGSLVLAIVLAVAWLASGFHGGLAAGGLVVGGSLGLVLAALWYRLAIQWVDEHEGWSHFPARGKTLAKRQHHDEPHLVFGGPFVWHFTK
jgi:hypothetical protein